MIKEVVDWMERGTGGRRRVSLVLTYPNGAEGLSPMPAIVRRLLVMRRTGMLGDQV